MGLGDLVARLAWDGSQFDRGTTAVRGQLSTLDKAFLKVGGSIRNTFVGAFTAHSVIRFGQSIAADVRQIQELANKFNITTTEVQLLQGEAERTHQSFEQLVDDGKNLEAALANAKRNAAGVLFPPETIKQIESLDRAGKKTEGQLKATAGNFLTNYFGGFKALFSGDTSGREKLMAGLDIMTAPKVAIGNLALRLAGKPQMKGAAEVRADEEERKEQERRANERKDALARINDVEAGKQRDANAKLEEQARERLRSRLDALTFDTQGDALTSIGNFLGSTPGSQVAIEDMNHKIDRIIQIMERETGFKFNPWPF